MAVDKTKDIQVGGTLHSIATGNVIAHADEVMDEDYGKKQSVINQELNNRLTEELKGYLPLTGGTITSESGQLILQLVSSGNESSMFFKNSSSSWALGVGAWTHDGDFVIGNTITSTYIQLKNDGTIITPTGVVVSGKSATDLLNAGGSTTPISDIVTQVQAAIVDSAPETLDTLNELAAALGDDPNFATTVTNQIAEALNSIKDNLGAEDLNAALPDLSTTHYLGSATTFIDCLKALDTKLYEIEQALTLKTV